MPNKMLFKSPLGISIEFEENKIIPNSEVYSFIQSIHGNPEDFYSGNLGTRIEEYDFYICKTIPLSKINYKLYAIDEDLVTEYSELKTPVPPILVDKKYNIEDGTHRCYAAKQSEIQNMYCFVPF